MTRVRSTLGIILIALGGLFYLMRGRIGVSFGRVWLSAYPAAVLLLLGVVLVVTSRWRVRG